MFLKLRDATPDDALMLRHWDGQPHVRNGVPDGYWAWETELHRTPYWRAQLVIEVDDKPIGFIQIIDPAREETHYWGDCADDLRAIDIWIGETTDLGKGYGTQAMCVALARCFADARINAVLIDPLASNIRAHRFYERLGFRFLENRRFGSDDCHVYRLTRADWVKRTA